MGRHASAAAGRSGSDILHWHLRRALTDSWWSKWSGDTADDRTHSRRACRSAEVDALDAPATYLNWNFILISIPNVVMIVGMVAVFVLALVVPFPSHAEVVESEETPDA